MTTGSEIVTIILEDKFEAEALLKEVRKILLGLKLKSTYDIIDNYPNLFDLKLTLESELREE